MFTVSSIRSNGQLIVLLCCRMVSSTIENFIIYNDIEQAKLIQETEIKIVRSSDEATKSTKQQTASLRLVFCFLGLNCAYLIWGVYQERIMTTKYLLSSTGKGMIVFNCSLFVDSRH